MQKEYVPASDLVSWRRHTLALMSDGHMLEKTDVEFKKLAFETSPRKHSYGWKDKGKVSITKEILIEKVEKLGYIVV